MQSNNTLILCYLCVYSECSCLECLIILFLCLFQDHLHKLFELERTTAHAIVSKMIINEEIMASLDEPTQCMVRTLRKSLIDRV